jgi:hypothetical protein
MSDGKAIVGQLLAGVRNAGRSDPASLMVQPLFGVSPVLPENIELT